MAITGGTGLTGIFGDPVAHSASPAMHNAAYAALGMDRAYVPFHVLPAGLPAALCAITAIGLLGVNITVPHKERVARLLKNQSAEARLLGAVNCVLSRRGELFGDNTDARGLAHDLTALDAPIKGQTAILIGAGGGAAAAMLALRRLGARRVIIANRTRRRARNLAARFKGLHPEVRALEELNDPRLIGEAAVVINATPIGLGSGPFVPFGYEAARPGCFFYDLIYAAEPTSFLRPALARGLPAADGAGMLLYQGALAFELFNGVKPPLEAMRRALYARLNR
ncbi:MAG TPA: shikimate dehydrogenase [Candidatus Binataceae bacterium]|jgi:shikimate dehydrogenase|nr:shikimate dehydrogenase [Candidatus Binataceae bacterium]